MARSAAAVVKGFSEFDAGVVYNKVGSAAHARWLADALAAAGLRARVLGGVPKVRVGRECVGYPQLSSSTLAGGSALGPRTFAHSVCATWPADCMLSELTTDRRIPGACLPKAKPCCKVRSI